MLSFGLSHFVLLIAGVLFAFSSQSCSIEKIGPAGHSVTVPGSAQAKDITTTTQCGNDTLTLKIIEPENGTTTHNDTLWVRGSVVGKAADFADIQLIKMTSETGIESDHRTKRNGTVYS